MRIGLIVEGKTEKIFMPHLRTFLESRLSGNMPKFELRKYDGRIPKADTLKRDVGRLLGGTPPADCVIALTDVFTGSRPPEFNDAADAKEKMRHWVGDDSRFHPHAAQFEFEAWLLPYWPTIQRLAKHKKPSPPGDPENVNHGNPPSHHIRKIFEEGKCRDSYIKTRDAGRILRENDLALAVSQCVELKAFVNTILKTCGGEIVP